MERKEKDSQHRAMCCLIVKVVPRGLRGESNTKVGFEDLKCDVEMGPTSD